MNLWAKVSAPLRGYRLLRRVLVELRGIRRALERQADALELAQGGGRVSGAQSFRNYSRVKEDLTDRELSGVTEVSYVDADFLAMALAREEELRAVLGRDPTPEEIERALSGAPS